MEENVGDRKKLEDGIKFRSLINTRRLTTFYFTMALLEFYGKECPHCIAMQPDIEKLEAEGFTIEHFETWHDEANAKKLQEYDTGLCGGVPFFFNTESKQFLCGEADAATLKKWAEGKKV